MPYKGEIPKYMKKTREEELRGEEPYSPEEFKKKRLAQGLTPTEITTPSSILGEIQRLEQAPLQPAEIPQTAIEQPKEEEKSLLQNIAATREFQPLGITGMGEAGRLLTQPSQELGRAGTETIIGAGLGLGLTATILSRAAASTGAFKSLGLGKLMVTLGGGGYVGKIFIGRQLSTADNIKTENLKILGDVNTAVKTGQMSMADALQIYAEKEQEIITAERQIKWITNNKVLAYLSGGKDTLIKFNNARNIILPSLRLQLAQAQRELQINQLKARFPS